MTFESKIFLVLRFININKTFIEDKKMINLEDINTKENLIQDFYRWLFDNNNVVDKSVILEKEVDFSLAPYYTDPYIYYPKQIAKFF